MELASDIATEKSSHLPDNDSGKYAVPAEPQPPQGPLNLAAPESEPYPEGGRAAYLSLFGCFCAWMCAFGLMNTIGTFQAYLGTHQLAGYSEADIGWIFGLYLFMAYCCGVQTGPIFDAMGPRWLTVAGSVCLILAMFLLEACSRGYHLSYPIILLWWCRFFHFSSIQSC